MKLCIADPPYLGRGAMLYGPNAVTFPSLRGPHPQTVGRVRSGDDHPESATWDDPETHRALVDRLRGDYDGWVIAMNPADLYLYLNWVPTTTRVCAWVKPSPFPAGHVVRSWEPVLASIPERPRARGAQTRDSLYVAANSGGNIGGRFIGSKPPAWTRWVLDLLNYDPDMDTVDDLFGGSGAVAAEIAQGVMSFGDGVA